MFVSVLKILQIMTLIAFAVNLRVLMSLNASKIEIY